MSEFFESTQNYDFLKSFHNYFDPKKVDRTEYGLNLQKSKKASKKRGNQSIRKHNKSI